MTEATRLSGSEWNGGRRSQKRRHRGLPGDHGSKGDGTMKKEGGDNQGRDKTKRREDK